jgi:hypothetical protein
MSTTLYGLSIDTSDAAKLARFWAQALGQDITPGASTEFATLEPRGTIPRLSFHRVPEPKSVKNRLHLDLVSTAFEAETDRLLALGATRVNDVAQGSARWTTFADPEGNEFDLVAG